MYIETNFDDKKDSNYAQNLFQKYQAEEQPLNDQEKEEQKEDALAYQAVYEEARGVNEIT